MTRSGFSLTNVLFALLAVVLVVPLGFFAWDYFHPTDDDDMPEAPAQVEVKPLVKVEPIRFQVSKDLEFIPPDDLHYEIVEWEFGHRFVIRITARDIPLPTDAEEEVFPEQSRKTYLKQPAFPLHNKSGVEQRYTVVEYDSTPVPGRDATTKLTVPRKLGPNETYSIRFSHNTLEVIVGEKAKQ